MIFQRNNPLRQRWQAGHAAVGVTMPLAAPEAVEICGLLQFDFVLVDREHGALTPSDCVALVRAAQLAGTTPLVRVAHNHPSEILQALDAGAAGVMVPGVDNAALARQAVQAAYFAPEGHRGLAATRAAGWGIPLSLLDHVKRSNEAVIVVVLVESAEGMANLAEIAAVPGVDAVFLGPSDLSQSMGYPAQPDHPQVQQALVEGLATINAAGKVAGITAATGLAAQYWQTNHGARMIATGLPGLLVAGSRTFLREARMTEAASK